MERPGPKEAEAPAPTLYDSIVGAPAPAPAPGLKERVAGRRPAPTPAPGLLDSIIGDAAPAPRPCPRSRPAPSAPKVPAGLPGRSVHFFSSTGAPWQRRAVVGLQSTPPDAVAAMASSSYHAAAVASNGDPPAFTRSSVMPTH